MAVRAKAPSVKVGASTISQRASSVKTSSARLAQQGAMSKVNRTNRVSSMSKLNNKVMTGKISSPKKDTSYRYLRQKGVAQARKQEIDLVKAAGRGTRAWTKGEIATLRMGRWPKGYEGHHIRSVGAHDKKWTTDPRNIYFATRSEHLKLHGNSFRNPTTGKLIDRQKLMNNRVKARPLKK